MFRTSDWMIVVLSAVVVLAPEPARADTILYQDTFNRTGPLNGSPLEKAVGSAEYGTTANADWTSDAVWSTDGNQANLTVAGIANRYLPFTPQANQVYTLSVDMNVTSGSAPYWMAFGLTIGNSTSNVFYGTSVDGAPWMLSEPNGAGVIPFVGPGLAGQGSTIAAGTGVQTLAIVLNTTQPSTTAQFFVDGVSTGAATSYTTNPATNYIGFGNDDAWGYIDNVKLTVATPEPSTLALLASGLLGLLAYAWRRRK